MTLSLLTTPDKLINGIQSNVNAGRSQLPYTFQRKDYPLESVLDDGTGKCRIYFPATVGVDVPVFAGDNVYVYFKPNSVYKAGAYNVLSTAGGTNFSMVIDEPFNVTEDITGNGFTNLLSRENYKVNIEIFDELGTTKLIQRVFKYSPKPDGSLFIDLAEIVTEYQEQTVQSSLLYMAKYSESWDGQPTFILSKDYPWSSIGNSTPTEFGVNFDDMAGIESEIVVGDTLPLVFTSISTEFSGDYVVFSIVTGSHVMFTNKGSNPSGGAVPGFAQGTPAPVESPVIQSIYAMKQIAQIGGSNMWEYLLKNTVDQNVPPNEWQSFSCDGTQRTWNFDESLVRWRVENCLNLNASEALRLQNEIKANKPFTVYVDYSVSSADNANVGLALLQSCSAQTTMQLLGDGNRRQGVFEYPSGLPTDVFLTGVQVRPTVANGSVNCNIFSVEILPAGLGKLLTWFDNPLMWRGWKRTNSMVIDNRLLDRGAVLNLRYSQSQLDINKIYISQLAGGVISTDNGRPQVYSSLMLQPDNVLTKYMQVWYSDFNSIELTKRIDFELLEPCDNPIMISWLNSLGAFEQHLFTINQQVQIDVEQGLTGERAINQDQQNVIRTKTRAPLTWKQEMILTTDNLTFDQLNALREIKESALVNVWLNKDGSKNIYVVVNNLFSTEYSTEDAKHEMTIQIEFPDNFDFFKAKEY